MKGNRDSRFERLRFILAELEHGDGSVLVKIGQIPREPLVYWADRATRDVIITRERRQHYLQRHPEIIDFEFQMLDSLLDPKEVHRNRRDPQVAIIYEDIGNNRFLRIPLWISNRADRQNSVLSLRLARFNEVNAGRGAGGLVWKKG